MLRGVLSVAFQRQETGGDRRQGALAPLYRAGAGLLDRQGAVRASGGSTKSSSMAIASRSTWPTRPAKIFTRRGYDWTHRFKKIAHDAWHIKAASAVIDGEIVVPAADGTTDFSVLQNELKGQSTKIVLVAFDLLYLNGRDLRKAAALSAQGRTQEDHRRHRRSVQRKLRDRRPGDVHARLQARPRRGGVEGP